MRRSLALIVMLFALPLSPVDAEEPISETASESNPVYVKLIIPIDATDRKQDQPVVESWIAKELKNRGQTTFSAATSWVPLDLSPFSSTHVWNGNLGDQSCCPVGADIRVRAKGRIDIFLIGWTPGGADVTVSLTDEPGSRAIAAVKRFKMEKGMPHVAVLIGPPPEKSTPSSDSRK